MNIKKLIREEISKGIELCRVKSNGKRDIYKVNDLWSNKVRLSLIIKDNSYVSDHVIKTITRDELDMLMGKGYMTICQD